jgi:hypothetical protein
MTEPTPEALRRAEEIYNRVDERASRSSDRNSYPLALRRLLIPALAEALPQWRPLDEHAMDGQEHLFYSPHYGALLMRASENKRWLVERNNTATAPEQMTFVCDILLPETPHE